MSKTKLLVLAVMLLIVAGAKSEDADFEAGSSYNKVDDTTTVYALFWLHKSSGMQDSLQLRYTFPGKKQTAYVAPRWSLWLYDRNNTGTDPQMIRILVNDKGPAQKLELSFVKHDSQFGGDNFEAELDRELETALLNARTLEVFPPEGETAGNCKISGAQVNKFKTFLRNSAALRRPAQK